MAKCVSGREKKFYNPDKPIPIKAEDEEKFERIQEIHRRWDHASYYEMITVSDLMFVEDNQGVKKPMFVHTDVCTKFVTGVVMSGKDKTDCMDAIIGVEDDYKIEGHRM